MSHTNREPSVELPWSVYTEILNEGRALSGKFRLPPSRERGARSLARSLGPPMSDLYYTSRSALWASLFRNIQHAHTTKASNGGRVGVVGVCVRVAKGWVGERLEREKALACDVCDACV